MFILKSNDLKDFPFDEAPKLSGDLENWAAEVHLPAFNSWMLPQIVAYYGSYSCSQLEDGTYCPLSLLRDNIGINKWAVGLWRVITQLKRGSLVKTQSVGDYTKYSALVPIILYGIRQTKGIKYSQWNDKGLRSVMGDTLYEAATAEVPTLSRNRLLEIRQQGLTTMTGKTAGTVKKATSTWALTGIMGTELGTMPKLTNTMLTQIWVAHPQLRDSAMILDPTNWDNMPEPLVETEVLAQEPKKAKAVEEAGDLPWM